MSAASPRSAPTNHTSAAPAWQVPAAVPRPVFTTLVWTVLVVVLAWALAGLSLAMLGAFDARAVVLVGGVIAVPLWLATGRVRRAAPAGATPAIRWVRAAAVAVAVAAAVGNATFPGEHLRTTRDGGTYTATAGWLAADGDLVIEAARPPFDDTAGLRYDALGFDAVVEDGPLHPLFVHTFPALLATIDDALGLTAMLRLNGVIGGVALLALYAFAERLMRPGAALVAQLALAGNLVFVYFSRAPFSEPLTLTMLFGGLWALDQAVVGQDRRVAAIAGLLFGGTFLARLDGLVILLALTAALLPPLVIGRLRRVAAVTLAGIGVCAVLAAVDLVMFAPVYVDQHVGFLLPLLAAFAGVAAAAGASATGPGRAATAWVRAHRRQIGTVLAATIVVAGVYAYAVRPELTTSTWDRTTPIGWLQEREGDPVDEARTYAEDAARWLGWYLGLPALAAGVVGWAGLVRRVWHDRADRLAPFLVVVSAVTVLYVWRPSITPDHIWADRRFLPVVLPGLLVCGAWLLDQLWDAARTWVRPKVARAGVAALALLVVVMPLRVTLPQAPLHEGAGLGAGIVAACERVGDDAALLVLDERTTLLYYYLTQPLRSHCGVPVARIADTVSDERLAQLADRAQDVGRTLYLLAGHADLLDGRPVADRFTLLDHEGALLEQTLTAPPRGRTSYRLYVTAARVRPSSANAAE